MEGKPYNGSHLYSFLWSRDYGVKSQWMLQSGQVFSAWFLITDLQYQPEVIFNVLPRRLFKYKCMFTYSLRKTKKLKKQLPRGLYRQANVEVQIHLQSKWSSLSGESTAGQTQKSLYIPQCLRLVKLSGHSLTHLDMLKKPNLLYNLPLSRFHFSLTHTLSSGRAHSFNQSRHTHNTTLLKHTAPRQKITNNGAQMKKKTNKTNNKAVLWKTPLTIKNTFVPMRETLF